MNETYNDDIKISGDYYTTFDMNYGFAHYIAKYLDTVYPLIGEQAKIDYENNDGSVIRDITKPISVCNYFLASNNQKRLRYAEILKVGKNDYQVVDKDKNSDYTKLYNTYMSMYHVTDTNGIFTGYAPTYGGKYTVKGDLPLFFDYNDTTETYTLDENKIFTLGPWAIPKKVCELDSFVMSYLLGRTIGPNSSMEDIYYAQKLLIRDRDITKQEKGIWCPKGMEGTMYDFTETVQAYQASRVNKYATVPLFVTGYFDIFTEGIALKEVGGIADDTIRGL